MQRSASLAALLALSAFAAAPAAAQELPGRPHLNFWGVTGLVDMPSGEAQPDGTLSTTLSYFGSQTRTTLSFQIFPRLSGSFRYNGYHGLDYAGFEDYYDRNFDLQLQVLKEGRYLPSVTLGLQDFAGTGLASAEYIAATKTITPRLKVTGGLGWGRLASHGSLGSPFGDRPAADVDRGGKPNAGQWFRGPVAPFAGIEWQASDRLTLTAEYSSDAYDLETGNGARPSSALFERRSPLNFGLSYRLGERMDVGAYYLYGSEIGLRFSVALDPDRPPIPGSQEEAPPPILARPDRSSDPEFYDTAWMQSGSARASQLATLAPALDKLGITLESLDLGADTATVRIRNRRYDAAPEAIGRTARVMSRVLPASVETFRIVPVVNGLAASTVTVRRSDLEALENAPDAADRLLAVTGVGEGEPEPAAALRNPKLFPRFNWSLGPKIATSYFDPDSPVRLELDASLAASFEPMPGLIFSGEASKEIVGNIDESSRVSNSRLEPVRTNQVLYAQQGDPGIDRLTGAYYFDAGTDLYGRVTAGYLESMFGGISGELLWKPVGSALAFGAELNYVKQRDFDQRFGFQDYEVATGHLSAYYEFGNYQAEVDAGRYLAGDYGATVSLKREFNSGWKVGAFATFTDVSAADFGEGSFDKGLTLEVPLSWFLGRPDRRTRSTTIRPVQRDGGQRLSVDGRLYDLVEDYHEGELSDRWGRVWR